MISEVIDRFYYHFIENDRVGKKLEWQIFDWPSSSVRLIVINVSLLSIKPPHCHCLPNGDLCSKSLSDDNPKMESIARLL